MSIGKQLGLLLLLAAILGGVAAIVVATNNPEIGRPPSNTITVTVDATTDAEVVEEGQEIFVDEDSTAPNVEPPDILSLIMRPETVGGKSPLERCHDYGGDLTLDMICHRVDY